jgi:hypothetical protein
MKNLRKFSLLALVAMFFLAACKKDESPSPTSNNNPGGEPEANSFNVKMTDAPGDFEALDVTIVGVEAYMNGKGWVSLDNSAKAINVLSLTNGTEASIASNSNAEAGLYTKLKVKFDADAKLKLNANALIDFNGTILSDNKVQLAWMNSSANEVEIEINEEVSASSGAEVLLDFDVAASVKEGADKYILDPTIRVIKDTETGIKGEVKGTANAAVTLTDGNNTYSTFIDAQGKFMLRGVESGMYDLIIDAATDPQEKVIPQEKKINGVLIAEGEVKQMGQITLE